MLGSAVGHHLPPRTAEDRITADQAAVATPTAEQGDTRLSIAQGADQYQVDRAVPLCKRSCFITGVVVPADGGFTAV